MLKAIRLQNLRSFVDTKKIELEMLNVFIGPNNAGKTTFVGAVELFLRSLRAEAGDAPLAFNKMAAFASFDAVVRRHWSRNEYKPQQIGLSYEFERAGQKRLTASYVCRAHPGSSATMVSVAQYNFGGKSAKVQAKRTSRGGSTYSGSHEGKRFGAGDVLFHGVAPIFRKQTSSGGSFVSMSYIGDVSSIGWMPRLEVVKPFRPIPRSYYVLDDPTLGVEERELLAYLATIWEEDEQGSASVRDRIVESLRALGLTTDFQVVRTVQRRGPAVLELRVAPTSSRQTVTIADAGFGLSQILPLVVSDARLSKGFLIAYQPEVHLHPFAQARLADLFVNSVAHGNQVFVETHSPDLILRLQSRIAAGEIKASDVAVFCLANERGRSLVTKVAFDGKASPSVPWPPGFLDTSLTLARELVASRGTR